jgi:lysophospholipase L1-like esterase
MQPASRTRRRWLFPLALTALAFVAYGPTTWAQTKTEAKPKAPPEKATEPRPRPGSWMAKHEQFLNRAKQGDVNLLFLGDSITAGWAGNGKDVWERFYGPRHAANFGIGGDRTQHVLWRIENGEVEGIKPRVAVLMIGTNNVSSNSAEEIADGIKAIVRRLHEKLPETKLLLLAVFPRGEKPNPGRDKINEVNEKIASLNDGKKVTYLDIGKQFLNDDGTISKEIMPDYLHLSPKGYTIWADAIEPTLWKMLDEEKVKNGEAKSGGK